MKLNLLNNIVDYIGYDIANRTEMYQHCLLKISHTYTIHMDSSYKASHGVRYPIFSYSIRDSGKIIARSVNKDPNKAIEELLKEFFIFILN